MNKCISVGGLVVLLCLLAYPVGAANVAYINNSGGSVDYLIGYGHTVTYLGNPVGLTLGDLAGQDAVLVASNSPFSEPGNIGDVLGAFADAGGGVVLTEFSFQGIWALSGAIMGPGYSPFTTDPTSGGYFISSVLGIVYDPGNPLFSGLTLASVHTDYQGDVGLDPGATLVASWDSGRRAIGYRNLPSSRIVDLNLFPDGSSLNTDTQHLVANAIDYSLLGGAPPVPEPGSVSLLAIGALGLAAFARRKRLV